MIEQFHRLQQKFFHTVQRCVTASVQCDEFMGNVMLLQLRLDNPFRAVNFRIDEYGNLLCPNDRKFLFLRTVPVRGNHYGRTEELYQCEDCSGRPYKGKCSKAKGNRTIRLNEELTRFHEQVLANLNRIHGALLRMNRFIQTEGAFGGIKWNSSYTKARRRGLDGLILEAALISCRFNLHKFHLKSLTRQIAA